MDKAGKIAIIGIQNLLGWIIDAAIFEDIVTTSQERR